LIQLRSGHILLNAYLRCFQKSETATCPTCHERAEMVVHYLMHCPAHEHLRDICNTAFPAAANLLSTLLTSKKAIPHLIEYIQATERFA
ncbi:hypothetical protein BDV93DRAFT_393603, partial [Ceratobasidium sp. AG-I]